MQLSNAEIYATYLIFGISTRLKILEPNGPNAKCFTFAQAYYLLHILTILTYERSRVKNISEISREFLYMLKTQQNSLRKHTRSIDSLEYFLYFEESHLLNLLANKCFWYIFSRSIGILHESSVQFATRILLMPVKK